MGRIAGSIGLLIWSGLCFGVSLEMHVLDTEGASLLQAGAGHPFILKVIMRGVASMGQQPEIKGVGTFDVKYAGVRMMVVNGSSSSEHQYEVRINEPGTYTIGPAMLEYQGQTLQSNTVRVVVGKEQVHDKKTSHEKEAPILLRLYADKERVVVGERVPCRLRFYLARVGVSLRKFIEPDMNQFRQSSARGPRSGNERVNGHEYAYVEWEWDLYPQKAGTLIIPAYGADYDQEIERNDVWGGFGRLLGNYIETKRIYSNALSLSVDPLPSSARSSQAIGSFSALRFSVKPAVAKQGEGVVVALELIGEGDLDSIPFPELQGIPSEFKYYESKQLMIDSSMNHAQAGKRFEYILQGLKIGSWELPAQSFYYYDVGTRRYKELQSSAIALTIMPGAANQNVENKIVGSNTPDDELAPINRALCTVAGYAQPLPWWLFGILFFLPVLVLAYQWFRKFFVMRAQLTYRERRARYAFHHARKQLMQCQKRKDMKGIYPLFIILFADRWQVALGMIQYASIDQRLRGLGMDQSMQEKWNLFFKKISEITFGTLSEDRNDIFNQAKQWIDQLEALL